MPLHYELSSSSRRNVAVTFAKAVFHNVALVVVVGAALTSAFGVEVNTNHWYVRTRRDVSQAEMRRLAARNGFTYVGPVLGEPDEHHIIHRGVPHADTVSSDHHTQRLKREPLIAAAHQHTGYTRVKRGYNARGVPMGAGALSARELYKLKDQPNDPLYNKEWYLKNTGQAGGTPNLDLNVEAAWAQGVTGKGVTTAIMDDGIDYLHADLADNYNAEASWDFSSNDPYPFPRYTDDWFNSHGTRCAGEISAMRDNGLCGVGVAYNSKVAGLRMLDQPFMTDLIEANSMSYRPDLVSIYSASWGPTDDGRTVDGPRNLTMRAIVKGINEGRNGLGSIYVWASGDGGPDDDCNCDGYAASMWTISINSATNDGQVATYDESCSSTLASTFSNGKGFFDAGVATTDLYGNCTLRHSGTSAAAPEAAGVFALALEANPKLTWRDIQHLTVLTSKRNQLYDAHGIHEWKMNGAGLEFNHLFGFGVLDAGSMVEMAKKWKTLPERFHCEGGVVEGKYAFDSENPLELTINTDACAGKQMEEVNYLEHVQMVISLSATRRGSVVIHITSPMNTTSMILSERPKDMDSRVGFRHWPFMTTHTWAERPRGIWKLRVQIHPDEVEPQSGELTFWALELHGTQTAPYADEETLRENSKLDIVKRTHQSWKA